MDYLDAMVEARAKEFKLWTSKFLINEDVWRIYRDGALVAEEQRLEVAKKGINSLFNKLRDRAAMEAAFEAAYFQKFPPPAPSCIDKDCLDGKNVVLHPVKPIIPGGCYESFMRPDPNMQRFIEKFQKKIPEPTPGFEMPYSCGKFPEDMKPKIDWLALNKQASGR